MYVQETKGEEFCFGTHKTGWVVIPQCFGVTERLHGGVRLNDLILQSPLEEKNKHVQPPWLSNY